MSPYIQLFRRYLRDQGLPVTPQREAVADAIFSSEGHLSVEDIEMLLRGTGERIGKATIYRTVEILVRSGLVEEHDFGEGFKRYEHLFGQAPVREHLVCTECGKVQAINSTELARVQREVAEQYDFMPARYRLAIYGICKDCQQAGRELKWEGLVCPIEMI